MVSNNGTTSSARAGRRALAAGLEQPRVPGEEERRQDVADAGGHRHDEDADRVAAPAPDAAGGRRRRGPAPRASRRWRPRAPRRGASRSRAGARRGWPAPARTAPGSRDESPLRASSSASALDITRLCWRRSSRARWNPKISTRRSRSRSEPWARRSAPCASQAPAERVERSPQLFGPPIAPPRRPRGPRAGLRPTPRPSGRPRARRWAIGAARSRSRGGRRAGAPARSR